MEEKKPMKTRYNTEYFQYIHNCRIIFDKVMRKCAQNSL